MNLLPFQIRRHATRLAARTARRSLTLWFALFVIMFGAMYFYEHPEKFDAFMNWLIGHRYRP